MYTIIVADDEEEIRRSLIRKIDWDSVGFQVVGEAENGIEALELVEQLEPDLLLTDIRMPFVSGIDLARQVREIRPTMQIAFLSGYEEFSYAQQAIQYNIVSYMLKPISAVQLTEELKKIKEKIDQKFKECSSKSVSQKKIEKSEFLMPLLLDRVQDREEGTEHQELIRDAISCGILSGKGVGDLRFAVIVTTITDKEGKGHTTRASVNAVDSILKKYVKYSSVYVRGRIVSLLMATPMGFEKYLHVLVEDIVQSVSRIMRLNASIGISRVVNELTSCHECYLEALNAISYSGREGGQVHFITDEERVEDFDHEAIQKTEENFENLFRGGTMEELRAYMTGFFQKIEQREVSQTVASFVLQRLVTVVFQTIYAIAGNEAVQKLQQKFPLQHASAAGGKGQMLQFYIDLCTAARELITDQRKNNSKLLCNKAIKIIGEQYTDPSLSLVFVSAEIAVSPNYLSSLLKIDTGSTFKDLLTKKRIEMAKELLLCTSMKVREITEKCGYSDQNYFSYCFKKYAGVSPNSYRRSNEEKKTDEK
ncbi:response regulator [Lachnospiraceae bacterium ZAX-1]